MQCALFAGDLIPLFSGVIDQYQKLVYSYEQYCICLVGMKKGANRTMNVKWSFLRQRIMFCTRIKIIWEEQLHYITFVNAL